MKRKQSDEQEDKRELDHGPVSLSISRNITQANRQSKRIKRTRHDEDDSPVVSMAEMPAVQIGLVEGASGGRVAEVGYQNEISWSMPSTEPQSIQGGRNPRNTLPFTWEADCREGSKANSRRSLRGLYEEVHWAERLYGLHRARDDDAGVIDQAQARIVAARDKLSSKVEEMVSGGSYFILKDVLGSQKPISFGFD
ncbi:hypothetical protein FRC14_001879 [Serendipita sp. 396]|nr:hypothetical protein FRC14_001879 [Serendipita sp. 396]KAG8773675.1 hypothetical protein FRC15_001870 [Serendipita sp. 397]KAG8786680.1 hypothetical protein FRC16_001657 [Serendipita sp. 398]KAG8855633.1 hypothetical protein FRC20_000726 [Serendipita sp. 405]